MLDTSCTVTCLENFKALGIVSQSLGRQGNAQASIANEQDDAPILLFSSGQRTPQGGTRCIADGSPENLVENNYRFCAKIDSAPAPGTHLTHPSGVGWKHCIEQAER
jgi:hypothetical protein